MTALINLALGWGVPRWAARAFAVLAPFLLLCLLLWGAYALIYSNGEKDGAAKVSAKVERQHEERVAEARTDERAAQASADRIGNTIAKTNAAATVAEHSAVEDLLHAIDTIPPAPSATPVALPVAPTDELRDALNAGIDRANRAAETADAEP